MLDKLRDIEKRFEGVEADLNNPVTFGNPK